jgi:hypothetical protein
MNKKYQVFVSSTFRDLHEKRTIVVNATLKAGHFPVGMEYFAAGGSPKWEYITRLIDTSDYYAVIIADWYGSVVDEEGGISYTEKEFDYAVSRGLRPLVFPLASDAEWNRQNVERDPKKRARLETFKEKAGTYMAGIWKNDQELATEYLAALVLAIAEDPRDGWVRSSEGASPEMARELARLSEENNALRQVVNVRAFSDEPSLDALAEELKKISAVPGSSRSLYEVFLAISGAIEVTALSHLSLSTPAQLGPSETFDTLGRLASHDVIQNSGGRDFWILSTRGAALIKKTRRDRLRANANA